jgi:hypothetical protein
MENKTMHTIKITDETYQKITRSAKKETRTIKATIELAVDKYTKNPAKETNDKPNKK